MGMKACARSVGTSLLPPGMQLGAWSAAGGQHRRVSQSNTTNRKTRAGGRQHAEQRLTTMTPHTTISHFLPAAKYRICTRDGGTLLAHRMKKGSRWTELCRKGPNEEA